MSDNVMPFTGVTVIPDDPVSALEKAKLWGLRRVVICGWNADNCFIFGGSHSEIAESILLLDLAKKHLLEAAEV